MSPIARVFVAGLLTLAGVGAAVTGGVLAWLPAVAEARLALIVAADPTAETFPGVFGGASSIVATLEELATFDSFREEVARSGFAGAAAFSQGSSEDQQKVWKRAVSVTRIGDALVLRVQARATSPDEARELAGAVAHLLALRAPIIIGDHIVQAHVAQRPLLTFRGRPRVGYAMVSGGSVAALIGLALLVVSFWERLSGRVRGRLVAPSALSVPTPPPVALTEKLSPEDARYWLQKFLEQHQRAERKSSADIQTWDDVPETSRGISWLQPPDALLF